MSIMPEDPCRFCGSTKRGATMRFAPGFGMVCSVCFDKAERASPFGMVRPSECFSRPRKSRRGKQ